MGSADDEAALDEGLAAVLAAAFPDARPLDCRPLSGGVSARAVACRLLSASGNIQRVVVRRPRGTAVELASVVMEFDLLRELCAHGIAPTARYLDRDVPAIVLDYVDGELEFAPRDPSATLRQLAFGLAAIHAITPNGDAFDGLPRVRDRAEFMLAKPLQHPDVMLEETRVREVISRLWPWPQHNSNALLHGDYWPGNVLFRQGQVAAVIDWEEAAVGDPLADVAIARLDVLWAFGEEGMHAFTRHYRSVTALDWSVLPAWDLYAALRPMGQLTRWAPAYAGDAIRRPDITLEAMVAGHRLFVSRAMERL